MDKAQFDAQPLNHMLGISLLEQRPGYGRIVLRKTDKTPAGIGGSVHGGILSAMVDIVMLVAVFSDMAEDAQPAGTAELGVSYLRQAHGDNIYATAQVIKRGRQLAVIDVEITDDEQRLCSKARVTYAFRA
ncbi:MAG: PaaI family thioesterase [Proteobacteria bacterium]|jgi:uncharacterized protein (TIGR00369 family)|nr:PaaI family thioesterase [Pseudomonadota bacterium]MDA1300940.1 PaaI family thioesterase [Pseudomonadota bacterium]